MSNLLWFHAFSRKRLDDVLSALRTGPTVNPQRCRTHENEDDLGLGRHVYAYIGRTLPDFGDVAFALPLNAFSGQMSPFDTGGLVAHIAPVCTWQKSERRKYLNEYSWSTSTRATLLRSYPSTTQSKLNDYLDGVPPSGSGPHAFWTGKTVAAIWKNSPSDPRPWTWEGRSPGTLSVAGGIHAWSCPPALFEEITARSEKAKSQQDMAFFDTLVDRYRRGGVSSLVTSLREEQAA